MSEHRVLDDRDEERPLPAGLRVGLDLTRARIKPHARRLGVRRAHRDDAPRLAAAHGEDAAGQRQLRAAFKGERDAVGGEGARLQEAELRRRGRLARLLAGHAPNLPRLDPLAGDGRGGGELDLAPGHD